jgi:Tfp pilus assembly protein PilF
MGNYDMAMNDFNRALSIDPNLDPSTAKRGLQEIQEIRRND